MAINIKDMVSDVTSKGKKASDNPIHYITFSRKTETIDNKEIIMNQNGWEMICELLGTSSPSLQAKRLVALAIRLKKQEKKPK